MNTSADGKPYARDIRTYNEHAALDDKLREVGVDDRLRRLVTAAWATPDGRERLAAWARRTLRREAR